MRWLGMVGRGLSLHNQGPPAPRHGRRGLGGGGCARKRAAPSRREKGEVTAPRDSPGPPGPQCRHGDRRRPPPSPLPHAPSSAPRSRLAARAPCRASGRKLAGGARGAKPPCGGGAREHTLLPVPPSPGPGSFGVQPGPPPGCATVPGRSRRVSSAAHPATPGGGGGGNRQPGPLACPARGLARGVAGARGRRGRGGWGRCGRGRDRARGPTCPGRPGQWAPGVRKDRHIWTCSGAARAAGPRAPPAPLK